MYLRSEGVPGNELVDCGSAPLRLTSLTRTKVDMAKRGVQKVARMEEKDTHYDSQQEDRGADQFLVRLEDHLNFSHFVIFRST